ncbi:hypothetical protein L596_016209 [Steinernema carpocapsae]|uniref:Secreted protein n=1 Tax=Steinernema carpocapsae TaxID=34508 RepID=A0A4U5NHB4_STECR|nr:hypothetical protein L596_016209 [Steinernema carpocapsae]
MATAVVWPWLLYGHDFCMATASEWPWLLRPAPAYYPRCQTPSAQKPVTMNAPYHGHTTAMAMNCRYPKLIHGHTTAVAMN